MRLNWPVVALFAVVVSAILLRYTGIPMSGNGLWLLDRWTGATYACGAYDCRLREKQSTPPPATFGQFDQPDQ